MSRISLRSSSIAYNLPEPRLAELQDVLHGQWQGRSLNAGQQKRKLQSIQEEEEREVKEQTAKRGVEWVRLSRAV